MGKVHVKPQATDSKPSRIERAWIHFQKLRPLWKAITVIATLMGLLAATFGVLEGIKNFRAQEEPTTAEECTAQFNPADEGYVVETWFCETEFIPAWVPDIQVALVEENKDLFLNHLDAIYEPSEQYPDLLVQYLLEHDFISEPAGEDPEINRLFVDWSNYQSQLSLIHGVVNQPPQRISDNDGFAQWIFELRSNTETYNRIHLRVFEPSSWSPPSDSDCQEAIAEIIPIARGHIPNVTGDGTLDVIHGIASSFACFPPQDEAATIEYLEDMGYGETLEDIGYEGAP